MILLKMRKLLVSPVSGSWVDGRWVPIAPITSTEFKGNLQPSPGRDIELLPEDKRLDEIYTLYTIKDLSTIIDTDVVDIIKVKDENYEILMKAPWPDTLVTPKYNKYLLKKVTLK